MNENLKKILSPLKVGYDGVYECMPDVLGLADQKLEIELRESVASKVYDDYIGAISHSHSIPVMDKEVEIFLKRIPPNGLILDIGGCWGWHWRLIAGCRPDVSIIIVDFIRSNFDHAKNVLKDLVGNQIVLMHADATDLPFKMDENFLGVDGVWTVQTFQHIPDFSKAVSEAHRVLKARGAFVNYSISSQPHMRLIHKVVGREYVSKGLVNKMYWLARSSKEQEVVFEEIFGNTITKRCSEILFSPELHFRVAGEKNSLLGKLDSMLSNNWGIFGWLARQHSIHIDKM